MDECYLEHAERITRAEVESARAQARRELEQPAIPADWDGLCIECGDEVPAERVAATGSVVCVACKELQERARGRR